MSDEIGTLTAALAAVSKEVGSLQPDKRNAQQNYDYISADKILEIVGKALSANGLSIIPSIVDDSYENYEYTDNYGKEKSRIDARCRFIMTIAHTSGERINTPWTGYGTDYVTPDKALYKAITSGHKYFLMKLFNVGVGNEDGEHDPPPDARSETSPQAQAKRKRPTPPPASGNGHKPGRPLDAVAVKDAMAKKTANDNGKSPSDKQRKYAVSSLSAVTTSDAERHTISQFLFGKESSNDWTSKECAALIDWIDYKDLGDGDWQPNEDARQEAQNILRQDAKDKGQKELFAD